MNMMVNEQAQAIDAYYVALQTKEAYVHELFGFDSPVKGFEEPITIAAHPHPWSPKIDTGYIFNKSLIRRLLLSMARGESIMLFGDKGTGKSSLVQQIMARLNRPLLCINGGPGLDENDLLGGKTIHDGDVKAVDGALSYAVRWGVPVLLDELCTLRPGVLVSINDILQGDRVITLKHHGLDPLVNPLDLANKAGTMTILRHPSFALFATDNTGGKTQKDSRFNGVNTQNAAPRERFTYFKVNFMSPELEAKALMNIVKAEFEEGEEHLVPAQELLDGMVELAFRFRVAFEGGESFDNISFRGLKRWALKLVSYNDLHEAFIDGVYSNLESDDQQLAENLFDATFGEELRLTEEYSVSAADQLDAFQKSRALALAA
jgi:MoxR-like ATPase